MIRTYVLPCRLPHEVADALNRESGRIYTEVMVWHYRAYRRSGHWCSNYAAQKWGDWRDKERSPLLTAHSIDAAQEAFYKACRTAKTTKGNGGRYPHRRKFYRTTIWKSSSIRKKGTLLLLPLARGKEPIQVELPLQLSALDKSAFLESRLVYDLSGSRYEWHLVADDGQEPASATGTRVASVDLGEIHPAVVTDGEEAVVFSCRELRSVAQGINKRLAGVNRKMSGLKRGSRKWRQLKRRRAKFLTKQDRRRRDLEHKVSRSVVDWCKEHGVGTLALGDVRDVADKTKEKRRLNCQNRQKVADWTHGKMRTFIGYKAAAVGIEVNDKVNEAYTSQTCPSCGHRHKPKGRNYKCPSCKFCGHRDVVGAINILSRVLLGEVGGLLPPVAKYRRPFLRWRSPSDAGQVGWGSYNPEIP